MTTKHLGIRRIKAKLPPEDPQKNASHWGFARGSQTAEIPASDLHLLDLVRSQFDEPWYLQTYGSVLPGGDDFNAFNHYVRVGARLGHDPNPGFSELLYRQAHHDIRAHLLAVPWTFGFVHWVHQGRTEVGRRVFSPSEMADVRRVFVNLDLHFLATEYHFACESHLSPADYYFENVKAWKLSPSAEFSEEAYLLDNPDVLQSLEGTGLLSGFDHFLRTAIKERRKVVSHARFKAERDATYERLASERERHHARDALEQNMRGVTHPTALDLVHSFEFFNKPVRVELEEGPSVLLVVVPHFLPEVLFGGYQTFFEALDALRRKGLRLRLLVAGSIPSSLHAHNLMRMRRTEARWIDLFDRIDLLDERRAVALPPDYDVISYSAETHYIARSISAPTGRLPFFFIQDYEPDFHPSGDMRTFSHAAFHIPHRGIYNSAKLFEYFRARTDIFAAQGPSYRHVFFENWIRPMPEGGHLPARGPDRRRRLIFYGRPESHATRNVFGTFLLGLRKALARGVFDVPAWDFVSVGSLIHEEEFDLGHDARLRMITKLPNPAYEELLLTGDIGASFISTPHPGIIHFQMAAFGLTTLTNVTDLRTQEWLSEQCGNLLGVGLSIDAIAEGLARAVSVSQDMEARHRMARAAVTRSRDECLEPVLRFLDGELVA